MSAKGDMLSLNVGKMKAKMLIDAEKISYCTQKNQKKRSRNKIFTDTIRIK